MAARRLGCLCELTGGLALKAIRINAAYMKKSIGDNRFPKGMAFEDGLKRPKRSGYQGIELWLGDRPWFQVKTGDTELRTLFSKIQDAALEVSDVANSLDRDENVSSRDPAKREAARRHIERQIEAAQIFECDAILVVAGVVTSDTPYNEVYGRCVDSLQKLGETAARGAGQNWRRNLQFRAEIFAAVHVEFHSFLNEVNNPWVGIHLDVGNIHDTGFAEQWIEIHGPRITRTGHLKDVLKRRGRCGEESVYTNLLSGTTTGALFALPSRKWDTTAGSLPRWNPDTALRPTSSSLTPRQPWSALFPAGSDGDTYEAGCAPALAPAVGVPKLTGSQRKERDRLEILAEDHALAAESASGYVKFSRFAIQFRRSVDFTRRSANDFKRGPGSFAK